MKQILIIFALVLDVFYTQTIKAQTYDKDACKDIP